MTNDEKILEAMPVIEHEDTDRVDGSERPYTFHSFTCPLDLAREFIDVEGAVEDAREMGDVSENGEAFAGCIAVTAFDDGACEATIAVSYDDHEDDGISDIGHVDLARWERPGDAPAWWTPMLEKVPKDPE